MATQPRVSGQAGQNRVARWRDRQWHGGRCGGKRRVVARHAFRPTALSQRGCELAGGSMNAEKRKRTDARTVLAIDAGNTRIKWGIHDGARWRVQAWVASARASELKAALARVPAPQAIVISN